MEENAVEERECIVDPMNIFPVPVAVYVVADAGDETAMSPLGLKVNTNLNGTSALFPLFFVVKETVSWVSVLVKRLLNMSCSTKGFR